MTRPEEVAKRILGYSSVEMDGIEEDTWIVSLLVERVSEAIIQARAEGFEEARERAAKFVDRENKKYVVTGDQIRSLVNPYAKNG